MRRGIVRVAGIAAAAAIALAGAAIAQDPEDDIEAYVRSLIQEMATEDGEALVGVIETEELETADTYEVTFQVDPEKSYFVYGACDDDCTDVDLAVTDASGDYVDYDEEADDTPMILILPDTVGDTLIVRLSMIECETATCIGGIGLFEADF